MVPLDSDGVSPAPPYSGILYRTQSVRLPDSHRLWSTFPRRSANVNQSDVEVLQPRTGRNQPGLGSSPFARHYLGNHCYFLFLRVLRCFSSPGLPLTTFVVAPDSSSQGVAPFGNAGIIGYVPLPQPYRSLSRPSSPLRP